MFSPVKLYAIGGLLLGMAGAYAYHSVTVLGLEAKVTKAEGATLEAQRALKQRILDEAMTVAKQVTAARKTEREAQTKLQEDYDQLKTNAAADFERLTVARSRLRQLASKPTSAGIADLPGATAIAGRVSNAAGPELPNEDRILIDELLQVASDANAAAGERNFLATQYEMNCRKPQDVR